MKNQIDILISKENKRKMIQKKEQENINFSIQLNSIFASISLLPIEEITKIIMEQYLQDNTDNITTVTILKKHIGNINYFNKVHELLKLKIPKLTFKYMVFMIIENHFNTHYKNTGTKSE